MKTKTSIFLLTLALGITSTSLANASAGWYPTKPGDFIDVSVCLPSKHGKIIYLQGSDWGKDFKTFIKFKPRMTKDLKYCPKGEREFTYPWKVNTKGEWSLSFYDPTYKKRYYGWPDGIESK